jgi:myo-inositol 2-dehydrogenase/D-chiro-inositol 1-dehydrogenase
MGEQLRVGIVGTGAMGQIHAQAWSQTQANLCGIVSKSRESAVVLAQQYGANIYPSLEAMLLEIDVLDICTPTHLHRDMALAAAAAQVHVVCEKPLARSVAQAEEMIAACGAAGVKLLVAHVVRFFPEYALVQQKVAAGEIGDPAVIRLKRGSSQPTGTGNWFADQEKSGGIMLDLMIHDFDYARWIGGEVKTVFAKSIKNENPKAEVDHALVILTHESGIISHIEGSWAYPAPLFRTQIEVAGSNGLIQHDSDKTAATGVFFHQRSDVIAGVPIPSSPLHEDPYTTQIKAFYQHIQSNDTIRVSAVDGLEALKIGLAAIESAQTGLPIQLNKMQENVQEGKVTP